MRHADIMKKYLKDKSLRGGENPPEAFYRHLTETISHIIIHLLTTRVEEKLLLVPNGNVLRASILND